MGVPKFRQEQIKDRRRQVAELYLQGWFQADIAAKFNVSQAQISYDLKVIYRMWRMSTIRDFDQLKEQELMKLNKLEQEAWSAWHRSRCNIKRTTSSHNVEGKTITENNSEQNGDPRFLSVVESCIKKRSELLGLDAPKKTDNKHKIQDDMTDEDRDRILKKLKNEQK